MNFQPLPIPGAFKITTKHHQDERGFFTRLFCSTEFAHHGISEAFVQTNYSHTSAAGTLRGLHYQLPPSSEGKLVTCISGRVWDCLVDLRKDSSMYCKWFATVLSPEEKMLLYIPKGVAHGFITLEPSCGFLYQVSACYDPMLERGVRWNDPAFSIDWPIAPQLISPRDADHPDFKPHEIYNAKETDAHFVYR